MTPTEHLKAIQAAKDVISKARGMIPNDLDDALNNSIDQCGMAIYFINEYIALHIASLDKSDDIENHPTRKIVRNAYNQLVTSLDKSGEE